MPQIYPVAQKAIPSAASDGVAKWARSDQYGAFHARNELLAWAEEGSYFKVTNPTPGTGIAMGIQTTFSDTANVLFLLRNGSATKYIIPHYIRLVNTVAGASTTSSNILVVTDTGNRYTAGGTDLTTDIVCANSGLGPSSAVDVARFGIITAAAVVAKRKVARSVVKTQAAPCWIVGDEVKIAFSDDADQGLLSGAAAARFVVNTGPVVLGAQNHCLLIHMWNIANATTAPSWELEAAWWER